METALFSLTEKRRSEILARFLVEKGWRILSTGGTAKHLRDHGVPVVEVSDYTGMPEGMGGRIKTLHPKICGGVLGRPDIAEDAAYMRDQGIEPIGLVAVNLYAFNEKVATIKNARDLSAMESIDIGGPTLLRAAAKNCANVIVLTDPDDYDHVITDWKSMGHISPAKRLSLSAKAFRITSVYDEAISAHMYTRIF